MTDQDECLAGEDGVRRGVQAEGGHLQELRRGLDVDGVDSLGWLGLALWRFSISAGHLFCDVMPCALSAIRMRSSERN